MLAEMDSALSLLSSFKGRAAVRSTEGDDTEFVRSLRTMEQEMRLRAVEALVVETVKHVAGVDADVSRPLGSVSKLVKKRHRVIFDDPISFIQNKVTGKKINLREQGGLYFLDLWVQVPEDLVIPDRFVRQVEQPIGP